MQIISVRRNTITTSLTKIKNYLTKWGGLDIHNTLTPLKNIESEMNDLLLNTNASRSHVPVSLHNYKRWIQDTKGLREARGYSELESISEILTDDLMNHTHTIKFYGKQNDPHPDYDASLNHFNGEYMMSIVNAIHIEYPVMTAKRKCVWELIDDESHLTHVLKLTYKRILPINDVRSVRTKAKYKCKINVSDTDVQEALRSGKKERELTANILEKVNTWVHSL